MIISIRILLFTKVYNDIPVNGKPGLALASAVRDS